MANIKFLLNKGLKIKNRDKQYPIYVRYRMGRLIDFSASIGFKVFPDWWDTEKQRVKNKAVIKDKTNINRLISDLNTHFSDFEIDNKQQGITPSYADVKNHYHAYFKKPVTAEVKPMTLFDSIDEQIENAEKHKIVESSTINSYRVTKEILSQFNIKERKIDFNSINLEFYYDFIKWCNKKKLSKNYVGKHIKTLKTFMAYAVDVERKYTDNFAFKHKEFKVLKEDVYNVYLTEEELRKMWDLDLTHLPKHDNARDLFLIGAYTGLRVSDYNHLKVQDMKTVNGVEMISVKTKKMKRRVAIPIHPIVKMIFNKNNGNTPKKMPDQHINYKIKEVAENCGIDGVEFVTKTIGGKEVTNKFYKYELIKTHTARRSFCSNAYLAGMDTIDIMSISQHRTESAFMKYIKLSPEDIAIKMSKHKFFKDASVLKKA